LVIISLGLDNRRKGGGKDAMENAKESLELLLEFENKYCNSS
jgi:hypothetical protein